MQFVMEEKVRDGLLFDFYGDLLSEKQKNIYRAYAYEDLSLSEMADEFGMTRQGISETIHRATKNLREYEERLGLEAQYRQVKALAEDIEASDDAEVCHAKAKKILELL